MKKLILLTLLLFAAQHSWSQETYAEKLGFPKGVKILILHVDDVGMSLDSNQGAINAIEKGVATSLSVMMPCPWVPGFIHYKKDHPNVDAGLHLTLTSEWKDYRWSPLSGKQTTPGLVDEEGAFWSSVEAVIKNATADEVETEIRAQIDRARTAGFEPTHLDSHMGTLFASPEFLQRYIKVGIENKIPVMLPAGNMALIGQQLGGAEQIENIRNIGKMIWNAGLPVLDDLHAISYSFEYPKTEIADAELQKLATAQYIKTIQALKPGLSMVIMHCTAPTEVFPYISDSYKIRKGDLLAMMDPAFKKFLQSEGIILTTWREVKSRRDKVK
jgi:predicted glycoside hydrolase/deacetylase ChbG (UPF0249 family)